MRAAEKAFTLVEVMVTLALAGILGLAGMTYMNNLDRAQRRIILINTLSSKKMFFDTVLSEANTFLNTKDAAVNTGMQCLRDRVACPPSQVEKKYISTLDRLVLYDSSPNPGRSLYDGTPSHTKGFTEKGTECTGFVEAGAGNDNCPIGYIVNWFLNKTESPDGVRVTLNTKMIFNPSDKHPMKTFINTSADAPLGPYDSSRTRAMESVPDVAAVVSCNQDGIQLFNGGTYPFYATSAVPDGSTCSLAENRVCNIINGIATLYGSNLYAKCVQNCYGEWSNCSAPCGGGSQTFVHKVPANQWGAACTIANGATQVCNTQSCSTAIDCAGTWQACSVPCGGGTQSFSVTTPASNGGAACPASPRACNTQACSAPIDCTGSWGACSVPCGGGTQNFVVTTPASNGGAACPVSPRACNTSACVTIVNGACNNATLNACSSGTFSDVTDSGTQYKWKCNGSGGGSSADCIKNIAYSCAAPGPAGMIINGGGSQTISSPITTTSDHSIGVLVNGTVNGDLTINTNITVSGAANTYGILVCGNITGKLTINAGTTLKVTNGYGIVTCGSVSLYNSGTISVSGGGGINTGGGLKPPCP